MFDTNRTEGQLPLKGRSLNQLGEQISSPDVHAGGGSAAAASASLAAATAELVVILTAKRQSTAEIVTAIEQDSRRLKELRGELLEAGDADEAALDRLMHAYRAKGASQGDQLVEAAETSLAIAGLALEVIEIAAREVPLASRFTASDLGAAAALAQGAATAALLTAGINIQLLVREGPGFDESRDRLGKRAAAIEEAATEAAQIALSTTRERIGPSGQGTL